MRVNLPTKIVPAGTLLQHLSRVRYRGQPLYYGDSGTNRYDDPAKTYGVLYLADSLQTALMESIFHKHKWHSRTKRMITQSEVEQRMVRAVGVLDDLHLADLSAPNVMASQLGLNLNQLTSRSYRKTQTISANIHAESVANGGNFDGMLYPSRNNYPAVCIALFDMAKVKLDVMSDINLPDHTDWPSFVIDFQIVIAPR